MEMSIAPLARKLAVLLALITGQRLQTLKKIRVENIIISTDNIPILITDEIRTTERTEQQCLHIPFFPTRPGLCAASTLLSYLQRTAYYRSENNKFLFILTRKPFRSASRDTIGHWVKETLAAAGINVNLFGPYSTRHSSTSAVKRASVSLDCVRRTAGWSQKSDIFAKFYNCGLIPLLLSQLQVFLNK